jgi:hypothetical protein
MLKHFSKLAISNSLQMGGTLSASFENGAVDGSRSFIPSY